MIRMAIMWAIGVVTVANMLWLDRLALGIVCLAAAITAVTVSYGRMIWRHFHLHR